jgi:hypothetical protein
VASWPPRQLVLERQVKNHQPRVNADHTFDTEQIIVRSRTKTGHEVAVNVNGGVDVQVHVEVKVNVRY